MKRHLKFIIPIVILLLIIGVGTFMGVQKYIEKKKVHDAAVEAKTKIASIEKEIKSLENDMYKNNEKISKLNLKLEDYLGTGTKSDQYDFYRSEIKKIADKKIEKEDEIRKLQFIVNEDK